MRHLHQEPPRPSFVDKAVSGIEKAGAAYAAAKTVFHIAKGMYTMGRIAAPLLLAA